MVVFFNVSEDVNFMYSTFLQFLISLELFHFNNLNSILLIIKFIHCSVHFSVGSFTYNLIQSVILDYSNHLYFIIIKVKIYISFLRTSFPDEGIVELLSDKIMDSSLVNYKNMWIIVYTWR